MLNIRVCKLGDAPGYMNTWATKAIGIVDPDRTDIVPCSTYHVEYFHDTLGRVDGRVAASMENIARIFAVSSRFSEEDRILVHCHAGMSCSPAIAIGILVQHGVLIDIAIDHIHGMRPTMTPNLLLIELIDAHLGLGGELIAGINSWHDRKNSNIGDGIDAKRHIARQMLGMMDR